MSSPRGQSRKRNVLVVSNTDDGPPLPQARSGAGSGSGGGGSNSTTKSSLKSSSAIKGSSDSSVSVNGGGAASQNQNQQIRQQTKSVSIRTNPVDEIAGSGGNGRSRGTVGFSGSAGAGDGSHGGSKSLSASTFSYSSEITDSEVISKVKVMMGMTLIIWVFDIVILILQSIYSAKVVLVEFLVALLLHFIFTVAFIYRLKSFPVLTKLLPDEDAQYRFSIKTVLAVLYFSMAFFIGVHVSQICASELSLLIITIVTPGYLTTNTMVQGGLIVLHSTVVACAVTVAKNAYFFYSEWLPRWKQAIDNVRWEMAHYRRESIRTQEEMAGDQHEVFGVRGGGVGVGDTGFAPGAFTVEPEKPVAPTFNPEGRTMQTPALVFVED